MSLENNNRKKILKLVEKITTSKNLFVESAFLKELKEFGKKSDQDLKDIFDSIWIQLKEEDSRIRYLCLILVDEFFSRSKLFRTLLIDQLKDFIVLTIGVNENLPSPDDIAIVLREKSLGLIEKWSNRFGTYYESLVLGYDYLKNSLKMKFPLMDSEIRERERQAKMAKAKEIALLKYNRVVSEIDESLLDIESNLQQMESCFHLLVPDIEESFSSLVNDEKEEKQEEDEEDSLFQTNYNEEYSEDLNEVVDEYALGNMNYSLTIDVGAPSTETSENSAIYENLRGYIKICVHKHLPLVKQWINIITKADPQDKVKQETLLKKTILLRNDLEEAKRKCHELKIDIEELSQPIFESPDDDFEFMESSNVETQPPLSSKAKKENSEALHSVGEKRKPSKIGNEQKDPVLLSRNSLHYKKQKTETDEEINSEKAEQKEEEPLIPLDSNTLVIERNEAERLLKNAPVLPFFPGLMYWGKSKIEIGFQREHRFYGTTEAAPIDVNERANEIFVLTRYLNKNTPKELQPPKATIPELFKQKKQILQSLPKPHPKEGNSKTRLKRKLQKKKK